MINYTIVLQIECPLMSGALGARGVSVVARVEEGNRPGRERALEVISVQAVALSPETAAWSCALQVSSLYMLRVGRSMLTIIPIKLMWHLLNTIEKVTNLN